MVVEILYTLMCLFIAFVVMELEAVLEAYYGDKKHWWSVVVTFVMFAGLVSLIDAHPKFLVLYLGARMWFDLRYNKHKGNHWTYLGGNAKWDNFVKSWNPYLLLAIRAMVTIGTILICFI